MPEKLKFLLINGSKCDPKATRNFTNAAKQYFETVLVVDLDKIRIECKDGENKLFYKNTDLTTFDACYIRLFSEDFMFGQIVMDILENSEVYIPASLDGLYITNHKYYIVKALSKVGIPIPPTGLCTGHNTALKMANKTKYPAVVKLLSGFGGRGVMLANGENELKPLLDTVDVFKELVCIQKFIKNKGEDYRCYVVGDAVHAVKRHAAQGDWRTNISRGGNAQLVEIPSEYKEVALKSAKLVGMDLCAVDLLEGEDGIRVIEVNFSPGTIIKFFGNKFAEIFIQFIFEKTKEYKLIA